MEVIKGFFILYGEFVGFVLGFIGAVMATISISPFSKDFGEGGTTTGENGKTREFVYLTRPFLAKCSIVVIVVAFFCQLVGMILNLYR